jgi:outer membrane protein assembly factor BamE (lipoprotein component of BamABCDE complex)
MGRMRDRLGLCRLSLVLAVALSVTACVPIYRNHGYIPPDSELAQISVGTTTRDAVLALAGPPTTAGVLPDDALYYVQSRFRHYGPLAPEEIERQVLVISFAASGLVANVERFGLADGQVVTLSRRVTDDNIRDTTLIRQILGAIGNFDAGRFIGSD